MRRTAVRRMPVSLLVVLLLLAVGAPPIVGRTPIESATGPRHSAPVARLSGGTSADEAVATAASEFPPGFERYHTYAEMESKIRALEASRPGLVRVRSIGESYEGRRILAVKISDNVARDEDEPEILIDGLHHAREHLSAEQALSIIDLLVDGYGTDERVTNMVQRREWWIVPMVDPDGGEWDIRNGEFHAWRKNRQPNGADRPVGTDLNRNYGYRWGCCGGSSGSPGSDTYRGASRFSAPETQAMADFVRSRVVGGVQQIKAHLTFHSTGKQVLWPYAYTYADVPSDMRLDDHRAFVALGRGMAERSGYTPMQSSDLYPTDGDQIDWMYGRHRIFSFTVELYPSGGGDDRWYTDDELIGRETRRNHDAVLYLASKAACPWSVIGKADRYCG